MDHGVNAEALAPIKAGAGPLVVGVVLILRVPADAVGIGLVVGPGVAAESGEVLVEAATIRDIEAAALEHGRPEEVTRTDSGCLLSDDHVECVCGIRRKLDHQLVYVAKPFLGGWPPGSGDSVRRRKAAGDITSGIGKLRRNR